MAIFDINNFINGNICENKKYAFVGTVGAILFGLVFYIKNKNRVSHERYKKIIDLIPELKRSNVKIKSLENVEKILSNIVKDSKKSLQVICDFDRTITKYGQKCSTSCSVLENSRFVSQDVRLKFDHLRNIYLPIELDPTMTKDEKIPFMIEWWTKSQNLTVSTSIHRDSIIEMVKQSNTALRDGCNSFFYSLERNEVPILIFSAGIGNIVQEFIVQQCGNYQNMKIVSNFMKFNNITNRISGFQGKLIHVYNKNESVLIDTDYEKLIEKRSNVILIGDSLGDTNMAEGFPLISNELKIGFLNDHVDKFLPIYLNKFDIVIIEDHTFDIPNSILAAIFQS